MPECITIVGDGAMGTICAMLLSANGHQVRMWSAFADAVERLRATHENARFLPGVRLSDTVEFTADAATCLEGSTLIVSAVPAQYLRDVWTRLAPHLPVQSAIVSCTKGIEIQTRQRPTQIIEAVTRQCGKSVTLCALSGPNIAGEIARHLPATAVAACADGALAARVQSTFTSRTFRVYTNSDVVGVEIAGAVKNVIALAAGIADGLRLGCNAKAALLARGLVEISRLGIALGAQPETFSGLAGMGDLVTTCISPEGRNRSTGEALGRGRKLDDILRERPSVVEGVPTTRAVMELARECGVEMPLTAAVHSILFEDVTPAKALDALMARQSKPEK